MLEALIVMLVISILYLAIPIQPITFTSIFSENIKMQCLKAQEQAFASKQEIYVRFESERAQFGSDTYVYPKGFVCEPASFHYNFNGNISKGGHVICHHGKKTIHFIFQIGTGRVRVE